MTCEEIQRKLGDYFDSGLAPSGEVERHMATCGDCRSFAESLGELSALLSESTVEPPRDLAARVNAAVADHRRGSRKIQYVAALVFIFASTAALNWFVPVLKVMEAQWAELNVLLPESEWLAPVPSMEAPGEALLTQIGAYVDQLESYPTVAVWGALLAAVLFLAALNGFEAAGAGGGQRVGGIHDKGLRG